MYILASGCSMTSGWGLDKSAAWPQLLATKLGVKCVNVSESGQSNLYIYNSIVEHILETDEKPIVCVMWTEHDRFSLPKNGTISPKLLNRKKHAVWNSLPHKKEFWDQRDNKLFLNIYCDNFHSDVKMKSQSEFMENQLEDFCKVFKLQLISDHWPKLNKNELLDDGKHPNTLGHLKIAEQYYKSIHTG